MNPVTFAQAARPNVRATADAHLRRWAIRADVVLGITALILLTAAGIVVWLTSGQPQGLISGAIAGWVALTVACLGAVIKITSARQNLVKLFASEIRAIQFGLSQMD